MLISEALPVNLNSAVFSAVPGASNPWELIVDYRKILIKSYQVYFQKISETLKLDLKAFVTKIQNLNVQERFSPALFVYYDLLREGYRTKNLHQIFDALQAFKNLNESEQITSEITYSTILTETWEFLCVPALRQTPSDELEVFDKPIQMISLVHWDERDFPPTTLKEAIESIGQIDPFLHEEFQAYVTSVKLYAGKILESTTGARFFGAIYLRLPYPHENAFHLYLRNIVHEVSHLHLYAMMAADPMVLNPESERFSSPLRQDRRPMIGLFHATFVLSRMVRAFKKYHFLYPNDEKAKEIFLRNEKLFLEGLETVRLHAKLTEKGNEIFNSLKDCAFS